MALKIKGPLLKRGRPKHKIFPLGEGKGIRSRGSKMKRGFRKRRERKKTKSLWSTSLSLFLLSH